MTLGEAVLMATREIIYFGDPMCSWCWGFSPVIKNISQTYADDAPVSIVVGGLHAFDTDPMNDDYKATIQHHWEDVSTATGAVFDYAFFDREGFVLDTEPACRAAVTVRDMDKSKLLHFYDSISRSFYSENKDTTNVEIFKLLATEAGLDADAFQEQFESDALKETTRRDFQYAKELGVTGFPTVVVQENKGKDAKLALLSAGYQPYDSLAPIIDDWLTNGFPENSS